MPKNRKTREQKFRSDIRKQSVSNSQPSMHFGEESLSIKTSAPIQTQAVRTHSNAAISTSSYSYLSKDLWKTFSLTVTIVLLELILHYFLK